MTDATLGHIAPAGLAALAAALANFTGPIEQMPPAFSALKVDGQRAYDLARAGEEVVLKTRAVTVFALSVTEAADQLAGDFGQRPLDQFAGFLHAEPLIVVGHHPGRHDRDRRPHRRRRGPPLRRYADQRRISVRPLRRRRDRPAQVSAGA